MFSSQKVFGSRLLEMSSATIGRLCSGSSLSKSVIIRSQQISKLSSKFSDLSLSSSLTDTQASQGSIEVSEPQKDLLNELKDLVDLQTLKGILGNKASLNLASITGVGSKWQLSSTALSPDLKQINSC